ncbi:MAG: glycine zipper 2TM domain-containing protein [Leptospira sp.]|nr:glycine zipper 2TM domain-containing protein [Leptospira sp.]
MEQSDQELLQSLIAGGIVGGVLGAILSDKNDRSENSTIAAIAGAAILASYKASQNAKNTNLPIYKINGENLVVEHPDGRIEIVKKLNRRNLNIPTKFKINR